MTLSSTIRKSIVRGAAVVVAGAGVLAAGASPAQAASCFGGAQFFNKTRSVHTLPTDGTHGYFTTSACSDINIKTDREINVKVCFAKTGCQSGFTLARANRWTVVATNVRDGAAFRFSLADTRPITGFWAA